MKTLALILLATSTIFTSLNQINPPTKENSLAIFVKGYYIVKVKNLINKKDKSVTELRFNKVSSALLSSKFMYDKFGNWTKIILDDKGEPILVWENIKLVGGSIETYTVLAGGVENMTEMYASVSIFNSKNLDCLSKQSVEKDKMIKIFVDGIATLNSEKTFYDLYWKMRKDMKIGN